MAKPKTEEASEEAKKIVDDAKNFIEKAIGDIGKTSATKQLILGTASGWYVILRLFVATLLCIFLPILQNIYKYDVIIIRLNIFLGLPDS